MLITINKMVFSSICVIIFSSTLVYVQSQNEIENNILQWQAPLDMKKNFSYFLSGFDHDGGPVWVIEFGRWDLRSLVERGGQDGLDFDKYIDQMCEHWAQSPKLYSTSDISRPGFSVISDLDGYSNRQFSSIPAIQRYLKIVSQFTKAVQRHPESFKKGYVINANYLFQTVWNLSKPIFGDFLRDIQLFGTNAEKWKPLLRKDIPKDQLPDWLGGSEDWKVVKAFG